MDTILTGFLRDEVKDLEGDFDNFLNLVGERLPLLLLDLGLPSVYSSKNSSLCLKFSN
jgi:hypothetical protein